LSYGEDNLNPFSIRVKFKWWLRGC